MSTFLAVVLDVNPTYGGRRQSVRDAAAAAAAAASTTKVGGGPGLLLPDVVCGVAEFCGALSLMDRENEWIVIATTPTRTRLVATSSDRDRDRAEDGLETEEDGRGGAGKVPAGVSPVSAIVGGVLEVVRQTVSDLEAADRAASSGVPSASGDAGLLLRGGIAAGVSAALCAINKHMGSITNKRRRTSKAGLVALSSGANDVMSDLLGGGSGPRLGRSANLVAPHILVVQTSPDDVGDYNALMNCAFAAARDNVIVDALYLTPGDDAGAKVAAPPAPPAAPGAPRAPPPPARDDPSVDSPLLQQLTSLTNGVYMPPVKGSAQVDGGITQILLTVYLGVNVNSDTAINEGLLTAAEGGGGMARGGVVAPDAAQGRTVREVLARVLSQKVDFRGRCFKSGEIVDIGVVCNLCLSVFKPDKVGHDDKGRRVCHTCGSVEG